MSAIFGIWRKDHAPQMEPALAAMETALCEWLCDTRGVLHRESIGAGARVLFTTPESTLERAPFTHPTFPHLVLTADAWLDNRDTLCNTFGISRERAATCDSELILRAYAKWGDACADKLRGDFAFALWDARLEQWYCARDFMGVKPFFYFDAPQQFCFASDVRAVLACPGVPNRLDKGMLAAFLVRDTIHAEKRHTFYQNIFKLPPAHFCVVTRSGTRLTRYWSPDDAPAVQFAHPDAYAEQTQALLKQAVQNATRATVRVGAHLSGGLDSTAIAILAARDLRAHGESLNGYSWSPSPFQKEIDDHADERTFIEMVCAAEHITPRYLEYSPQDAVNIHARDITRIPREMALREEQVQDACTQDNTRVLLSGWGGDELISYSGRGYLPDLFQRGEWRTLHAEIQKRIPPNTPKLKTVRAYGGITYRQIFWNLMPDWAWRIHSPYAAQHRAETYIHPDFLRRERNTVDALRGPLGRDFSSVRTTQTARLEQGHLSRRMESWATHGAKRGLVYRYPLLDRELVEFGLGLPPELFFQEGHSRAVLRSGTRGILPETLRATRAKTEPTALGIVLDTLEQSTRLLYEQTRPRFGQHPAAQYVDVAKIQKIMANRVEWNHTQPILFALSFFYIGALD